MAENIFNMFSNFRNSNSTVRRIMMNTTCSMIILIIIFNILRLEISNSVCFEKLKLNSVKSMSVAICVNVCDILHVCCICAHANQSTLSFII